MNILRIQITFPAEPPQCTVKRSIKRKLFTVEMSVNHPELTTMNIVRALELWERDNQVVHMLKKSKVGIDPSSE